MKLPYYIRGEGAPLPADQRISPLYEPMGTEAGSAGSIGSKGDHGIESEGEGAGG